MPLMNLSAYWPVLSWLSEVRTEKKNCWDNAVAEMFFKNLKVECVYQKNTESLKKNQF
jgi:transposase InsO family protein